MIEAAIFDWDGTLADTFPIALEAFKRVVPSELTEEEFRDAVSVAFGIGVKGVVKELMARQGKEISDEEAEELARKKIMKQVEFTEKTELLPGVVELLNVLRLNKMRMAICSSNHGEVIRPVMEFHGLNDYFEVVIEAENTHAKHLKPYPDIFLNTAEELGVEPEKCCVFEDSPPGIEAAKRAGMLVIAVETGPFGRAELAEKEPDLIVDTLEDVNKICDFLGL